MSKGVPAYVKQYEKGGVRDQKDDQIENKKNKTHVFFRELAKGKTTEKGCFAART